jgi:hypothetical protein
LTGASKAPETVNKTAIMLPIMLPIMLHEKATEERNGRWMYGTTARQRCATKFLTMRLGKDWHELIPHSA